MQNCDQFVQDMGCNVWHHYKSKCPHTVDQTIIDFSVVNSRQDMVFSILKTPPLKTQEALFVTQHYKNSLYMFTWSDKSIIQMLFQTKISIHSKEYWSVAVGSKVGHLHDDIMTWKHFLHNLPFVRGIHQSLVDSPNKGQVMLSFVVFFAVNLNELLDKWSGGQWFETS